MSLAATMSVDETHDSAPPTNPIQPPQQAYLLTNQDEAVIMPRQRQQLSHTRTLGHIFQTLDKLKRRSTRNQSILLTTTIVTLATVLMMLICFIIYFLYPLIHRTNNPISP